MTLFAPHSVINKRTRFACKRIKMKKKNQLPIICDEQKPGTMGVMLSLLCLVVIFAILAYFRLH